MTSLLAALALALAPVPAAPSCGGPVAWPHWQAYGERFIEESGRVVDLGAGRITTSEGQAYGMFMALVANDRDRFDRLLRWTRDHLADGDLENRLPAWKWGRSRRGWGVLDRNSASDADLWLAYVLVEAGQLWSEPSYDRLGRRVLDLVARREVARLGELGPMLLPGPVGFEVEKGKAWRLNPSYLPPSVLRRLSSLDAAGPWQDALRAAVRTLRESAPNGFAADWVVYRAGKGFATDPVHGPIGSYDAIRVYLWVGMLHPEDPDRQALVEGTGGMLERWASRGALPEKIDVESRAELGGRAPPGFSAALLPAAVTSGDRETARQLEDDLARAYAAGLYGDPPAYYDQNLILFGKGFREGRFWFALDGRLVTAWREQCEAP